jgi:two-component system, LytTR family, response regulator
MRCIIVDDEPLAIDLLSDFIGRVPFLEKAAECKNAIEAIEALNRGPVDLIFLDIQMPNISGIQLLNSLDARPMVIFTTAYSEYALESYNLNAIDYLLKPFTFERFLKAVNKAYTSFTTRNASIQQPLMSETSISAPIITDTKTPEYIFVKADYKTVKINLDQILYIEGLKDYIKIFTGSKPVITQQSLKSIEEKLPLNSFFRVHKSYIVSLRHIHCIDRGMVRIGEARIPIGESYKEKFQIYINSLQSPDIT